MARALDDLFARPAKPAKYKKIEEPDTFSLEEFTASLPPHILQERIDAESSMYRWVEVVMGYGELPATCDYRLYEPIHRPMCDRAEQVLPIRGRENRSTQKKLLDMEPRGSLKTFILSAGSALYYLVFNYDARILFSSHNHKAAKEILGIVKWNIESNPRFKRYYGDWSKYAKRYGRWRDDLIELAFRNVGLREPTIDTTGAEISKTGGHYDLIIVDDIQTRENVQTESARESVRARFQEYFPQLQPYGGMIVPSTHYHRQDAYHWIKRRRAEAMKNPMTNQEWLFDIITKSAWNDDGSLYYPTRLSQDFLAQQEIELEDYLFSAWYRNETIDDRTKVFVRPYERERDFDFVPAPIPYIEFPNGGERRSVYVTLAWDPAGRVSTNRRADSHGLTCVGTDSWGIWWVLHALELKLPLDQLLEKIAMLVVNNRVQKLSIETRGAGMQGLYVDLLKPVFHRLAIDVPIHEWSPGNSESKDTQIRSLQPRFKTGHINFRKGYCTPLLEQMDNFPQLEHDDVLDSLVQHKEIAKNATADDYMAESVAEGGFDSEEGNGEPTLESAPWVGLGTPDFTAVA